MLKITLSLVFLFLSFIGRNQSIIYSYDSKGNRVKKEYKNGLDFTISPDSVKCSAVSVIISLNNLNSGNNITYNWSPSNGLNITSGTTVMANPSITTTYTITATNIATGCTATKKKKYG